MGFHPSSVTKWSFDEGKKVLTLSAESGSSGNFMVDFPPPVPFDVLDYDDWENWREIDEYQLRVLYPARGKIFHQWWQMAQVGRLQEDAVQSFFRMVDASSMPTWTKRMALHFLESSDSQYIREEIMFTRLMPEHEYCEEYCNALIVVQDGNGYAVAEPI
jgi:hypothetical protein